MPYFSLTCHYISEYELKWKVLSTEPLHDSHTGTNIANKIKEILDEFAIEGNKVIYNFWIIYVSFVKF